MRVICLRSWALGPEPQILRHIECQSSGEKEEDVDAQEPLFGGTDHPGARQVGPMASDDKTPEIPDHLMEGFRKEVRKFREYLKERERLGEPITREFLIAMIDRFVDDGVALLAKESSGRTDTELVKRVTLMAREVFEDELGLARGVLSPDG